MGEELRRLLRSGFVQDTLFPITGRPDVVRAFSDQEGQLLPGVMGQFERRDDEIQIRGGRPAPAMRRTLTHEAGHRLLDSLVTNMSRGEGLASRELRLIGELQVAFEKLRSMEARDPLQAHAQKNQIEQFATAFQQAMQQISRNGIQDTAGLGRRNERIPGTAPMFNFLKQNKVFER